MAGAPLAGIWWPSGIRVRRHRVNGVDHPVQERLGDHWFCRQTASGHWCSWTKGSGGRRSPTGVGITQVRVRRSSPVILRGVVVPQGGWEGCPRRVVLVGDVSLTGVSRGFGAIQRKVTATRRAPGGLAARLSTAMSPRRLTLPQDVHLLGRLWVTSVPSQRQLPAATWCCSASKALPESRHADVRPDMLIVLYLEPDRRKIPTFSSYTDVTHPHVVPSTRGLIPRSSTC